MDSYKARKTERRDGAAHPHLYDTQSALFSSLFIQAVLSPLLFRRRCMHGGTAIT